MGFRSCRSCNPVRYTSVALRVRGDVTRTRKGGSFRPAKLAPTPPSNAAPNAVDSATKDLMSITGQRPYIRRARHAISNFKLREGNPIGVALTLRGVRMWEFYDRLVTAALPRVRDFRGVSPNAFDGHGNYSLGLTEQLIFPEVSFDNIDRVRGLQVNIVTTAPTDEEGKRLLELLGMPFVRPT